MDHDWQEKLKQDYNNTKTQRMQLFLVSIEELKELLMDFITKIPIVLFQDFSYVSSKYSFSVYEY